MKKKDVLKLKAGTWIEVEFSDSPNEIVLLLEKPEREIGDLNLRCAYFDGKGKMERISSIVHTQIVKVIGPLVHPLYAEALEINR